MIYEKRRRGDISAAEAKDQYVNLMRWRLEKVLGYATTHPLELKNSRDGTLYHMIFANGQRSWRADHERPVLQGSEGGP